MCLNYLFTVCSGLAIVSRFPFKGEPEFEMFEDRGSKNPRKWKVDGEIFAGKGVGRVQIEPFPDVNVSYNSYRISYRNIIILN